MDARRDRRPEDEFALLADNGNTRAILNVLDEKRRIEELPPPATFRTLYDILETRIKEHPSEAKEKHEGGKLPIHRICSLRICSWRYRLSDERPYQPPESLIRTVLQAHPEGACERDHNCNTPLHCALYTDCSTIFFSSCLPLFAKAITIENHWGETAIHTSLHFGAFVSTWSLLHAHPQSASIPDRGGTMPLDYARRYRRPKVLLVELALSYGAVPQVPAGPNPYAAIDAFEEHPSTNVIGNKLPLSEGDKDLLLKESLRANCPWFLFDFLFTSFPEQRLPVDPRTGEPRRSSSPFEVAVRNLLVSSSEEHVELEQLSMVYTLFRDNPMHYLRPIDGSSGHRRHVQES